MFKVECDSTNSYFRELEAPTSCLQWFTESFGSFSSFNFDATAYFAPDQVTFLEHFGSTSKKLNDIFNCSYCW